ncbi:MAG TPA: hydroxymethylbilane synthase [Actinomycetota bacterium]
MQVRIGTRGSPLALAQAAEVAERLGGDTLLVPITTAGDRGASPAGSPAGVKGLFVAEITEALVRGDVDLAVHSAKDLPSDDPEGVIVAAVPERALPYDVLVTRDGDLPDGGRVGTGSLRRRAQLLRSRPGLTVEDVRGNVETRLRKLSEGAYDALVLAAAGLARLTLEPEHAAPIPVEEMVPAPGQGALAVQAVAGTAGAEAAAALDHQPSRIRFEAERELVRLLGGGCRLPLGAYAEVRGQGVRLLAVVIRPDGSEQAWAQVEADDPAAAAREAAGILRAGGAEDILREAGG